MKMVRSGIEMVARISGYHNKEPVANVWRSTLDLWFGARWLMTSS